MKIRIRVEYQDERILDEGVIKGHEFRFDLSEFIGQPEEFKRRLETVKTLFTKTLGCAIDEFENEILEKLKKII